MFDTLCVFSKFWGVLNKLHMFPAKLVTIIHHPPFNKMMRYAKSDVSIFFTPALAAMAAGLANDKRIIVPANWYPDTMWYERNKLNVASEKKYDFLDNGKTARDHDLFIRSMRKLPHLRGVIVTDGKHVPAEYREGENIDLYFQDVPNDLNMLPLCVQSRVMLIPLCGKGKGLLGPVGYTSYMDAIALGMPVVSNNNAAYAYELEENKTGLTYSSDADDISQVLQESIDRYEELSANMRAFCNVHSIKDYEKIVIPHLVHK